ncbi:winged helix-turn-helix domain-containing protein [Saccharospirillum mangrovi]|uniref:winged helix-turn-helix domain-containing protein n=1 Tax=Saccharospirillum mangrovi TaxID=2161747 RepID=UPI000D3A2DEE|nr:winged helix-turn-helix domain-containing protein [Saccharospirillum mangrovi]
MGKKRILMVDSRPEDVRKLREYLINNEYDVDLETDGSKALKRIREEQPHLVLMEVDLEGESGLTICKLCRKDYDGGILFYTHRDSEIDQVLGLDMGADDYLMKGTGHRLVLARCQSLTRRAERGRRLEARRHTERLEFDDLIIDNTMREAWLGQEQIDLTSAEFDLLWLLSSHAGQILTREEIFSRLRGIEYDGQDRSVDVRVSRIRPKVGDDPVHPRRIKTVRSKGYLFVGDLSKH